MSNYRYTGNSIFLPNKCKYDEIFHAPGDTVDEKLQNHQDCMKRASRISYAITITILLIITVILALVLSIFSDTTTKIYIGLGLSIAWIYVLVSMFLSSKNIESGIAEIRNSYNAELKTKPDLTFEEFHKTWFERKRQDDYMNGNVRRYSSQGYSSHSSGPKFNINLPSLNFARKK